LAFQETNAEVQHSLSYKTYLVGLTRGITIASQGVRVTVTAVVFAEKLFRVARDLRTTVLVFAASAVSNPIAPQQASDASIVATDELRKKQSFQGVFETEALAL